MAKTLELQSDEWDLPLLLVLCALLAAAAGFFLLLYLHCQPTVTFNPGLAAYTPPPATRLDPLPRQSTAPELADIPPAAASPALTASPARTASSALTALAQAQPSDSPAKPARPPAHKRPRAEPSEHDQRNFGFAQQWNSGYRGWSDNRTAGGSKSWF
jgi:hypothetical protein